MNTPFLIDVRGGRHRKTVRSHGAAPYYLFYCFFTGVSGMDLVRNGRGFHTLPELFQAHKFISFFTGDSTRISEEFADLYGKGLSLRDIAKQTGKAKNTVRDALLRAGIALRSNVATSTVERVRSTGKSNIHFHAYYQGFEAIFDINSGKLTDGSFPNKAKSIVSEWALEHQQELLQEWNLAQSGKPLFKIPGADQ